LKPDAVVGPSSAPGLSPPVAGPIELRDVSGETGVAFVHTDGGSGKRCIIESVSAGLALFDYDGDGRIDLYFLNGTPLPGTKADRPAKNALYRNDGNWRFTDVTDEAGVGEAGYGLGVAVADYDNDGLPDLYVSNYGPNVLYRNNGSGAFANVTREAGVGRGTKVGAGACFLDIDGDGNLDLYVANYIKLSEKVFEPFTMAGRPSYPGPNRFGAEPDMLFRSSGDGTFTDVSTASGVGRHEGTGMGVVALDYDSDGDTDVFVCNDGRVNFLFENDGAGHFDEIGLTSGVAYNINGDIGGSMGADCGDFDNDGHLDLYVTNYQHDVAVLYKNLGNKFFEDVSLRTGAGACTINNVKWGVGFVDFDNDGYKDLFIAVGHLQDNIDQYDSTTSYRARNLLLRNTGRGTFENVSDRAGDGLLARHSARGAAFDDLDNDGDVDVVILNSREKATVLRNMLYERGSKNHWLQVQLRGAKTNRDGVGARVRVVAGDLWQIDEVHSGRGYQSHFGSRLYFGLGRRDRIDRIEVHWIGGGVDVIENLPVDRLLTITEGTSPVK
jgi:hypothetical protein